MMRVALFWVAFTLSNGLDINPQPWWLSHAQLNTTLGKGSQRGLLNGRKADTKATPLVSYPGAVTSKTCFDHSGTYTSFTVDAYVTENSQSGTKAIATHWTDDAKGWALRSDLTGTDRIMRFYLINGGWTSATCLIGDLPAGQEYRVTGSYNGDTDMAYCFINGGPGGLPGPASDIGQPSNSLSWSGVAPGVQMCVGGSNRGGHDFGFGQVRDFTLYDFAVDMPATLDATPEPTAAPTTAPTPTTAALPAAGSVSGSGGGPASAKGDPHLQNINGQRFDLMRPGTHVLLHIPRGADAPHVLLRVEAEVQRMGPQCGDMYFHDLNITGGWVKAKQGAPIQFHAGEIDGAGVPAWMTFGEVDLKVVHGHNHFGIYYLNLYVKHLGRTRLKVGGLLGEDDHEYEATPEEGCVPTVNLDASDLQHHVAHLNMPSASFAEANLA